MAGNGAYLVGLDRNRANYTPLTPLTFIERAAYVYPDSARRWCMASSAGPGRRPMRGAAGWPRRWRGAAIGKNDTVAVMAPNTPPMVEAAFGVPMCGAVLNTLNTRLDAETIAFMLRHGGAKVLITDREFSAGDRGGAGAAGRQAAGDRHRRSQCRRTASCWARSSYEAFLAEGDPDYRLAEPGGRMGRDRAELHVRHDGRSEGRRVLTIAARI